MAGHAKPIMIAAEASDKLAVLGGQREVACQRVFINLPWKFGKGAASMGGEDLAHR